MHPAIFDHFDALCRRFGARGVVLEIGATTTPDTLLNLPALRQAERRIGLNMAAQPPLDGCEMLLGNANAMPMIPSAGIDLVLCNSVLEHDRAFWLTLAEVRRVLKPGGLFMVGTPGFAEAEARPRLSRLLARLWPEPLPFAAALAGRVASTPTLVVHRYPRDYYRFGRDAFAEVLLAEMDILAIDRLLTPPRFIGVGRRR